MVLVFQSGSDLKTGSQSQSQSQSNQQDFQPSADALYTAASVAALNGSFHPVTHANADVINVDVGIGMTTPENVSAATVTGGNMAMPSIGNSQATIQAATTYNPHASYCNSSNNPLALLQHQAMNPAMQSKPNHNQSHSSFALPQQLHFNSLHSYPYRGPAQDSTPAIFQNVPLRRGKWTAVSNKTKRSSLLMLLFFVVLQYLFILYFILFPVSQSFISLYYIQEEETYANAIIEAFERGAIQGCENGCTLRAYLSRNLHCQPMRISKKYAGKAIGKQVFLSRLNVASERSMVSCNSETLKQLEFQFHMSVVQEGMSSDNVAAHHQKNAVLNGHGVAINPFFSGWHQQIHQSQHQQQTSSNVSEALLSNIPKYYLNIPTYLTYMMCTRDIFDRMYQTPTLFVSQYLSTQRVLSPRCSKLQSLLYLRARQAMLL